jgi:hypothetical protein
MCGLTLKSLLRTATVILRVVLIQQGEQREIESICGELDEFGRRSDSRFPNFHGTWWKLASKGVAVPPGQLEAIAEAFFKAGRLDPWYASCA